MGRWTPFAIKNLRLRLAWSVAEFSRRFGCAANLVLEWEAGIKTPTSSDIAQFESLEFHHATYCDVIRQTPHAESFLSEKTFEQIHNSQLAGKKSK